MDVWTVSGARYIPDILVHPGVPGPILCALLTSIGLAWPCSCGTPQLNRRVADGDAWARATAAVSDHQAWGWALLARRRCCGCVCVHASGKQEMQLATAAVWPHTHPALLVV
jgi:hypothetical protein